jgi:hypothetical protein
METFHRYINNNHRENTYRQAPVPVPIPRQAPVPVPIPWPVQAPISWPVPIPRQAPIPAPVLAPIPWPVPIPVPAMVIAPIPVANYNSEVEPMPAKGPSDTHKISVFIDLSNIQCATELRNHTLNISKLVELVEGGRNIIMRGVTGSCRYEDEHASIKSNWDELCYQNQFQIRTPGMGEQFVDQALQMMIMKARHTYRHDANKTIVLVSGDGNNLLPGLPSFPEILNFSAEDGFNIEVWSFSTSLSHKYRQLLREIPAKMKIRFLDDYVQELIS